MDARGSCGNDLSGWVPGYQPGDIYEFQHIGVTIRTRLPSAQPGEKMRVVLPPLISHPRPQCSMSHAEVAKLRVAELKEKLREIGVTPCSTGTGTGGAARETSPMRLLC